MNQMISPILQAMPEVAVYKPQRQHRFQGNQLIEALPLPLSEIEAEEALVFLPEFDPESRNWPRHERLQELLSLKNVMVPLSSHIELSLTLDAMLREGYVGRRPRTAEHVAIFQKIHADSQTPKKFRQTHDTLPPKFSTAITGVSGMGKTTTIERCLARYPRVIYHPDLDLYQITWLHFQMPSNGRGVKALLAAVVTAIAELIPDNTYFADHLHKATTESLQNSVRILMNKHCVGLLIPDEVQNAANSRGKSDQEVMTELTTLANNSRTPIIFVGTPKADKILKLDLRQARRSISLGLGSWEPLPRRDLLPDPVTGELVETDGEWVYFMRSIWSYSWLPCPQELDEQMLDAFYDCSQGIYDLAIKLYVVAQARAIHDDCPTLSVQHIYSVYKTHFANVHEMIDAIRNNDVEALLRFEDAKKLSVDEILASMDRRTRFMRGRSASARPGTADFKTRLAGAGTALGLPPEEAAALAHEVESEGTSRNMLDAVKQLAIKAAPPKKVSVKRGAAGSGKKEDAAAPSYPNLGERPDDLRHGIVQAAVQGTSIVEQLFKLRLVREPEHAMWEA